MKGQLFLPKHNLKDPPPSLAQWKRAGEGWHCLRAAPTRTIRSILFVFSRFHRFQAHRSVHLCPLRRGGAKESGKFCFAEIHVGLSLKQKDATVGFTNACIRPVILLVGSEPLKAVRQRVKRPQTQSGRVSGLCDRH